VTGKMIHPCVSVFWSGIVPVGGRLDGAGAA
jgi:hypothetical protein